MEYVASSCDRENDPGAYAVIAHPHIESFGPWSPDWGYGFFSAWRAMIYAYGFGRLEAQDETLDPGLVTNPATVFSDHFYLRGDLYVPADQTFRVSPLASVSIDPDATTPEGPSELGSFPYIQDIRVGGVMEIESSLENENSPKKGVNATISVEADGVCTVKSGGTVTVSAGQVLYVFDDGELNLDTGGEIIVEAGGVMTIFGQFNHFGTLTLEAGSHLIFGPTATVYLAADLDIPADASFIGGPGSVTTIASTDAAGAGNDPNQVEINCSGVMTLSGNTSTSVVIRGENTGSGEWAGINLSATGTSGSFFNFVEISDAVVGLAIGGDAPILALRDLTFTDCETGVRITGRYDISLIGAASLPEISGCTNGVELDQADCTIDRVSIHDNEIGVECTASSPRIRNCDIYANFIGVATFDANSIPDMGLTGDPGNNDFRGPGTGYPGLANNFHITALDPVSDIYAQENWWGTENASQIQARIMVIDLPPTGSGSVLFQPCLEEAPEGSPGAGGKKDPDRPKLISRGTHLEQNYPNPFNPMTTIRFKLEERSEVTLSVFDASGRLVRELANTQLEAGIHERMWDGADAHGNRVASGIYFYRLTMGSNVETKKMVLLK